VTNYLQQNPSLQQTPCNNNILRQNYKLRYDKLATIKRSSKNLLRQNTLRQTFLPCDRILTTITLATDLLLVYNSRNNSITFASSLHHDRLVVTQFSSYHHRLHRIFCLTLTTFFLFIFPVKGGFNV